MQLGSTPRRVFAIVGVLSLTLLLEHAANAQEPVDIATIERIKAEALERSQVMDLASWLTDVYGPRLTGSPTTQAASEWTVNKMKSWRIANVRLEQWNPFDGGVKGRRWGPDDRSWTNEEFTFRAVAPSPFLITAVPSVYSPSTRGRVTGPAVKFDPHSLADMLERFSGKIKGAFLLMDDAQPTPPHFAPQAHRWTDAELASMGAGRSNPGARRRIAPASYDPVQDAAWLAAEGAAVLVYSAAGDRDAIHIAGRGGGAPWRKNDPNALPMVKVSAESYGRMVRILEKDVPLTLELNMQNTLYENPDVFNIIAEIPGSDPQVGDQVVLLGAHFDSWTFGTGATDNAANVAVVIDALRILKKLNLQPRRTIRIALWTGHEQGGLGTDAYVQKHYRDISQWTAGRQMPPTKPEFDNLFAYFNLDNGTGKIRGVYQFGNSEVAPIFTAWMEPFNADGMSTATIASGSGPDADFFHRVGLPAFGFIQDPIEYNSRTHHTSADVYERLQPDDLKFNAAVVASFAWQAAQRNERIPRVTPQ